MTGGITDKNTDSSNIGAGNFPNSPVCKLHHSLTDKTDALTAFFRALSVQLPVITELYCESNTSYAIHNTYSLITSVNDQQSINNFKDHMFHHCFMLRDWLQKLDFLVDEAKEIDKYNRYQLNRPKFQRKERLQAKGLGTVPYIELPEEILIHGYNIAIKEKDWVPFFDTNNLSSELLIQRCQSFRYMDIPRYKAKFPPLLELTLNQVALLSQAAYEGKNTYVVTLKSSHYLKQRFKDELKKKKPKSLKNIITDLLNTQFKRKDRLGRIPDWHLVVEHGKDQDNTHFHAVFNLSLDEYDIARQCFETISHRDKVLDKHKELIRMTKQTDARSFWPIRQGNYMAKEQEDKLQIYTSQSLKKARKHYYNTVRDILIRIQDGEITAPPSPMDTLRAIANHWQSCEIEQEPRPIFDNKIQDNPSKDDLHILFRPKPGEFTEQEIEEAVAELEALEANKR